MVALIQEFEKRTAKQRIRAQTEKSAGRALCKSNTLRIIEFK